MTPYAIIVSPKAAKEFSEALNWYEERSETAACNFELQLLLMLDSIAILPYGYRSRYGHFPEASLGKYPYAVVYEVDEATKSVSITSIYHQSQSGRRKYR